MWCEWYLIANGLTTTMYPGQLHNHMAPLMRQYSYHLLRVIATRHGRASVGRRLTWSYCQKSSLYSLVPRPSTPHLFPLLYSGGWRVRGEDYLHPSLMTLKSGYIFTVHVHSIVVHVTQRTEKTREARSPWQQLGRQLISHGLLC
jgi:hypothetical protein